MQWCHRKTHNSWYFDFSTHWSLFDTAFNMAQMHQCLWGLTQFVVFFVTKHQFIILTWAELRWFWGAWLTQTDWWAGTLNSADWVITRKCSKLALIGPRLPKVPFGRVIFWESCILAGESFSKKWITVVKLWSGWIGKGWFRHLIISD